MKIRPATLADVPAVARIVLAALTDEAPWKAFFPPKAKADPTYIEYAEAILRSYLDPATKDDWLFLVVELTAAESRSRGPMVAAAAVWDTSSGLGKDRPKSEKGRQLSVSDGLHSNTVAAIHNTANGAMDPALDKVPGKLAALNQASVEGRRTHFGDRVPYIFLHLLATKPDFQKKGYAKALCASGLNAAKQKHASICVQSGSRGYILFSGLGFVDQGPVVLPTEPGTDDVSIKAMVLDARQIQRRGSIFDSVMRYITT